MLNKQREVIYARRRELLSREDLSDEVLEMVEAVAADLVASHCNDEVAADEWDWKALDDALFAQFNLRLNLPGDGGGADAAEQVEELVVERVRAGLRRTRADLHAAGHAPPREASSGCRRSTRCGRTTSSAWTT